jgi:hypothetical protein
MRQDFTLAIGSVARNPVFAVVSIFTIALGIGLNTSVFGIVNVLLFRPPSLDAAHELIWVLSASTKANGPRGNMTYPDVEDLRTLPVLAGVVTYGETPANVATTENAARLTGQLVTPDFFTLRALAAQVRALDATVAVFDPMTLRDHIANRLDGERALSRLLTLIGILTLVLAAIGLYGGRLHSGPPHT